MTDTWNNKTVERLIELNNLGYTCAEIAKALSLTRNAVIGKLYRLRKKQGKEKIRSWIYPLGISKQHYICGNYPVGIQNRLS